MTMKRNTYRLTSLLLLTVLLAGCTIEVSDEIGDNGGLVPIYLTAEVADAGNGGSATRAGTDIQSTQLASGETFTVEFSSNTTVASTTYRANGSGGTTCTGTQPYFTLSGASTTAYGYYPSKPGSTFSVSTSQNTDANYKASDLMYASVNITKSAGSGSGKLTFAHKMAKIIVNITRGDGISSISAVKIVGGYRTINVTNTTYCTLGTTLTDANSSANITVYSGNSTAATLSCAALIPPQTVSGNFLQIVTDKGTVTYSLSNKAFATAKSYTFNITINAAAIGTTVAITNWANNGSATVNPTVTTEVTNAPADVVAVDLGLSVKWANMNVGATAVTDYGTYFAWGETSGYTVVGASDTPASGNVKTYFSWDTYAWCKGKYTTFTKYCPTDKQSSNWWNASGTDAQAADNKTQLELGDDAARANWGGKWRMPTQAEMQELADTKSNTSDYNWTWCDGSSVKYNYTTVKGWKIESKKSGTAGNHIFLPAAGFRGFASFSDQGSRGYYWSSALSTGGPSYAWYLFFNSSDASVYYNLRFYGYTVRAVQSN